MKLAGRRILVDATSANIGGGYTYVVNVIPRLCQIAAEGSFRLLIRSDRLRKALAAQSNLEIVKLPEAGPAERIRHTVFETPKLAAQWPADLYFSVGELASPRVRCPSIASFRNAAVFSWEHKAHQLRDRIRLGLLYGFARIAARRCDRIMFVSHDSAQWIGDALALPEARRAVIHHGIDAGLWAKTAPYRAHPRPYILSVSSIYFYKNYLRLIEAYIEAARSKSDFPDLIIIGDDYDADLRRQMDALRQAAGALAERIHILGGVPYEEVKSYYKGASLFVFPSYFETFGHPLLEAMAAEIPLVASDIPPFREIAGPAARYAAHDDVSAIAAAIEEALHPETGRELVRLGRERIRDFTWDASAEKLVDLFEAVLHERGFA